MFFQFAFVCFLFRVFVVTNTARWKLVYFHVSIENMLQLLLVAVLISATTAYNVTASSFSGNTNEFYTCLGVLSVLIMSTLPHLVWILMSFIFAWDGYCCFIFCFFVLHMLDGQ
ncbi:hypothetical protein ACOSQ2_029937 [Xanthoceras sorbifolium]